MNTIRIEQKTCPVCGMDASASGLTAEHLGVVHHFCSETCRENFLKRPRLYPGSIAGAISARAVIKRRRFALAEALDEEQRRSVAEVLKGLMGVHKVEVGATEVFIEYNLMEIQAIQIEGALAKAGATLAGGWTERLRRRWVRYTEENELDNLAAGEGACCNKPPAKG